MLSGIIASTHRDAEKITAGLSKAEETVLHERTFSKGILGTNAPAVVCICGVGKTNAAHGATLLIERFNPGILYSIGVAGAYPSSGLAVGDVVIAEKEIYGDEGVLGTSGFQTMDALDLPLLTSRG